MPAVLLLTAVMGMTRHQCSVGKWQKIATPPLRRVQNESRSSAGSESLRSTVPMFWMSLLPMTDQRSTSKNREGGRRWASTVFRSKF